MARPLRQQLLPLSSVNSFEHPAAFFFPEGRAHGSFFPPFFPLFCVIEITFPSSPLSPL